MTMTNSMKTVLKIIYLGLSGLTLSACSATEKTLEGPPVIQENVPRQDLSRLTTTQPLTVAQGINEFATVLYTQQLKTMPNQNWCFSPYSISSALAMTYAGARGKTAEEMANVLRFPTGTTVHADFARLNQTLVAASGGGGDALQIANALWAQSGSQFLIDFTDLTYENYQAGLKSVNFSDPTGIAKINQWTQQETQGKITELVNREAIPPQTRLLLTNAIYFKGSWFSPFDAKDTQRLPFHPTTDSAVEVPMMFQEGRFNYQADDQMQMLELPYLRKAGEKTGLTMVIILPAEGLPLTTVEENLGKGLVARLTMPFKRKKVAVYLPRFQVETAMELTESLQNLEMTEAFNRDRADFSGMTGHKDLFLSTVLHKAFVEVNEKGTEAAAATATGMVEKGVEQVLEFRVNRPFLFVIRETATGVILFMGRVVTLAE